MGAALVSPADDAPPERVIVFAPHPDDEALVCAGVMRRAVLRGDPLKVVVATNGDAYIGAKQAFERTWPDEAHDRDGDGDFDMIDFGIVRHDETVAALAMIGVEASDIVFLGYPDFGLETLWTRATPYMNPFTLTSRVPSEYGFAHRVGAEYTRAELLKDIKDVIAEFQPTIVYSPRPSEASTDHWALGTFVAQALAELYSTGTWKAHLGYLVHWEAHDPGWPHGRLRWPDPKGHRPPDVSIDLADFGYTPDDKLKLIEAYKSQVNFSASYLRRFAKTNEVFWLESVGPRGELSEVLSSAPPPGAPKY